MVTIDLSSKRAKLALRFFTYGVMTVTTIILTVLAVFYAMGYRFDQSHLTFQQGGLVQFRSFPEGATVTIDGTPQSMKTPGRANPSAGKHTVQMQLDGYLPWQKTIDLAAGQLLWLNYARFVPNSVTTSNVKSFSNLSTMLASPDRKWLVLHEKPSQPTFNLVDANDETEPAITTLTIPDSQLTKKNGKFGTLTPIEWDLGSRYILVRHQIGKTREFIRVDRTQPAQAVNISRVFSFTINDAQFSGSNPNVLFVNNQGVLRRLDIPAAAASAALMTGVQKFSVYGDDTVSFVAKRPASGASPNMVVAVGLYERNKEVVVRTYPANSKVTVAFAKYFQHKYLAITAGNESTQILRDPITDVQDTAEFVSFKHDGPVKDLSFSNSGRMVVASGGGTFATYDLELGQTYRGTMAPGAKDRSPTWLDDYYMWTDADGKLRMLEFDGTNGHDIVDVEPGFSASLGHTGKVMFTIGRDAGKFHLQSSTMVNE